MNDSLFTTDFKPEPYWWDRTPLSQSEEQELPTEADVVIVGSGYTGLHAAIQTARAGLSTWVLEADATGWGCSTRNGGQISTSVKFSYAALCKRYGESLALKLRLEGQASLDYIKRFVRDESIDCDFHVVGRFHGAHSIRYYDQLAAERQTSDPAFDDGSFMVSQADQHTELGTDAYHGGIVFPHHASIDPGRYHAGILKVARATGVVVKSHCPVTDIKNERGRFRVTTPHGTIAAGQVIVATNGYTSGSQNKPGVPQQRRSSFPWLARRIVPIGSYIIATEPIERELMDRLMPTTRVLSDTRKLVYYYRPSPDRQRILFGGRVSLNETDPKMSAPRLHAHLVRLFPELTSVRVSHSWVGTVAYTFDTLMHAGKQDGLHYAMGYCGSGVGMASYLGMRIGQQAAGQEQGTSAFNQLSFPTRPLYTGTPWFLTPSILVYRLRDYFSI